MTPAPSLPPSTVAPMTPAATVSEVPSPSTRASSFMDRLRPRRAHVLAGLGLGLAFELLVDGVPVGLGLALLGVATTIAIIAAAGREGWQSAKGHRWLLVTAALLFSCGALQDAGWLTGLEVATGLVFAALALHGWPGEAPLSRLSPWRLVGTPLAVGFSAVRAGAVLSAREAKATLDGTKVTRQLPGVLRLLAIVVPPVLLVTALLASGDAAFGARVGKLADAALSIPIPDFVRGGLVTALAGLVLVGVLALATRRKDRHAAISEPGRALKATEAYALLGTLSLVLFAFGATTWDCALSPGTCALPPGVTYAEAAHEGFFQLLAAALVILALLMALPARTALASPAQEHAFRALAGLLVVTTLPMVLSGVARLARYEDAYGLTRLRIMAHAGLVLVGAVMSWRALTLWVARDRFVPGALGLVALSLFTLTALRPDAMIARHNLALGGAFDTWYHLDLSDDAAPALVAGLPSLDEDRAKMLRLHLRERAAARQATASLGGWNVGRWLADRAVAQLDATEPEPIIEPAVEVPPPAEPAWSQSPDAP